MSQMETHESCRIGVWYYGNLPEKVTSHSAYQQLEKPHKALHDLAKEAVMPYNAGDIESAEETFLEIEANSKQVVDLLSQLKQVLKEK